MVVRSGMASVMGEEDAGVEGVVVVVCIGSCSRKEEEVEEVVVR